MTGGRSTQIIGGAAISYLLIFVNTVYGLVLTPFIISRLGDVEFGVYKTIASLSSTLMVMDLGLGGTVTRYVAKYRSSSETEKIPNFLAIVLTESMAIITIVVVICSILNNQLDTMYQMTFSKEQLDTAHTLFFITSLNMCLTIIENIVNGVITGFNEQIFGNGIKLIRLLFRMALTVILLQVFPNAITLVTINIVLTVLFLTIECLWVKDKLGVRVKYSEWNQSLFVESFQYTSLMFISSMINQVNSNLDNIVIGATVSAAAVAVYSIGLTLYGMFEQLSTAVSGVMLPTVMETLEETDGMKKTMRLVVQCGRIQFALLGAVFFGFLVLGKEFIVLWLGESFLDAYYITLILMGPSIFSLTVNVCISILRAQNRLFTRTMIILGTTILNAIITIVGSLRYGYYAAAFGTSCSLILGVDILTNVYYSKVFSHNMLYVYGGILHRLFVAVTLPAAVTFCIHKYLFGTWISFILNVAAYIIVYIVCLSLFGFNKQEKSFIRSSRKRITVRKGVN